MMTGASCKSDVSVSNINDGDAASKISARAGTVQIIHGSAQIDNTDAILAASDGAVILQICHRGIKFVYCWWGRHVASPVNTVHIVRFSNRSSRFAGEWHAFQSCRSVTVTTTRN